MGWSGQDWEGRPRGHWGRHAGPRSGPSSWLIPPCRLPKHNSTSKHSLAGPLASFLPFRGPGLPCVSTTDADKNEENKSCSPRAEPGVLPDSLNSVEHKIRQGFQRQPPRRSPAEGPCGGVRLETHPPPRELGPQSKHTPSVFLGHKFLALLG